jgi:hypothetical protein
MQPAKVRRSLGGGGGRNAFSPASPPESDCYSTGHCENTAGALEERLQYLYDHFLIKTENAEGIRTWKMASNKIIATSLIVRVRLFDLMSHHYPIFPIPTALVKATYSSSDRIPNRIVQAPTPGMLHLVGARRRHRSVFALDDGNIHIG